METNTILSRYAQWPTVLAGLVAIAGIGISLSLHARIAQTEITQAQSTAETLQQTAQYELMQFVEVLESVRALHALSDDVNQAAMNEFINKGLIHQHAVLGAFGHAPRISHSRRTEIE